MKYKGFLMKNSLILYLFLSIFLSLPAHFFAESFFFDDFSGDEIAEFSDSINDSSDLINKLDFTPEEILGFLTGVVHWQDIANKDFFLQTHEIPVRHVLDLPFFNPYRQTMRKNTVFVTPFYAQISKVYFSKYSDHLERYLALNDQTLLNAIQDQFAVIQSIPDILYLEPDKVFKVLKDTFLEQRRLGLMVEWFRDFDRYTFSLQIPFVYLERNFQMTDENKKILEQELGITSSLQEQKEFQDAHLISDKLGFSDIRLHVARHWYLDPAFELSTGFFTTLPTGFSCSKGLRGSVFNRPSEYPNIDFFSIVDNLFTPDPSAQDSTFAPLSAAALDALDRLSALVLDMPIHTRRHVSLGVDLFSKIPFDESVTQASYSIDFNFLLSVEYFFPTKETRFFINDVDRAGFSRLDVEDFSKAEETLTFLKNESISRFFLRAFDARVSPGFIVRQNFECLFYYKKWTLGCGVDGWIKTKEKVHLNQHKRLADHLIDQVRSQGFLAYQCALTAQCAYAFEGKTIDWSCGLNLFASIATRAIGNEYGAAISFRMDV